MSFIDSYGVEYSDDRLTLIKCPSDLEGSYTILPTTQIIGKNAFKECEKITDLTIPTSTKIVEFSAFGDCQSLEKIFYDGTLEEWLTMDWKCFLKNGYDLYFKGALVNSIIFDGHIPEIRNYAFYHCYSLQHIEIRDGIEKIGDSAFNKTNITGDVYLPDSVKHIGSFAFLSCTNLKSISIPHISLAIGTGILRYCNSLEKVDIRGNRVTKEEDYYTIDGVVFHNKEQIRFFLSNKEGAEWDEIMYGPELYHYPCGRKESKYVIPSEVESIGDFAFAGITNLTLIFRVYICCDKHSFYDAKVKIQVPIGTKQRFIDGGYPKDCIEEIDVKRYIDQQNLYEKCINLVGNNPYRQLGVYSNASLREITANKTKLARYASVGKSLSFESDMTAILPPINRTTESVEKAFSDLSLPQDKIKHALTWFAKGGNLDEIALNHINEGNYDKAFEIFRKKETWSSLLNQGTLSLSKKDIEGAISTITKLIHNDSYRNEFVSAICDDSYKIDENDLAHLFIDILLKDTDSSIILDAFIQHGESADDDDYIKQKLTEAPVGRIKSAIAKAKKADPDNGDESYSAGESLMNDTKSDLQKLKDLCGDDTTYNMIADSLAKQILQCGINYYNNTDDDEYTSIDKAYSLQNYALQIAVGSIVRGRCKENVDILLDVKQKLPPKEVKENFDRINSLLALCRITAKSFKDIITLIKDCAPHLVAIKEFTGAKNEAYLSLSTDVVNAALSLTIDKVNKAQEKDIFGNYDVPAIKTALKEGWKVMLYLEKLDMVSSFKTTRFNDNKNILKKLINDLNGFGLLGKVFGESIVVDLDMRTEADIFAACKTKQDCDNYLRRYPNGKYVESAKRKIDSFDKICFGGCKTLKDYRDYLLLYPKGIYVRDAKSRIAELEEEQLWIDCHNDDTIDSYTKYLKTTKLSRHAQEAQLAVERIKEEQRQDETLWRTCKNKEDYEAYLKAYPRALHKDEANKRLEKIENQRTTLIALSVIFGIGTIIVLTILFG